MKRSDAVVPVRVGRYTLYGVIGSGGMATVHLGRASSDDLTRGESPVAAPSIVAIKRLRPHFASEPEVVKSFLDEARLSSSIRHPNVVDMHDVVTADGEVFLVMEYLEGVPLAALTRVGTDAETPLIPPTILVSIVASALHGLHAAHEAVGPSGGALNIVHRDVSPQNIFVGVDGTTRVLDFGIAKAIGREQSTRDNRIKGKLGYMAPEQLSARAVTRRTDVFAAGIILWEHLVGARLFRGESEAETVTRVLMEPVRAPGLANPSAPRALDAIVLRALERDPSKRFLTAEDMAHALEAALPAASPSEVGAWVRTIGAHDLERRARLVRDIETHAATGVWPDARSDAPVGADGSRGSAEEATQSTLRSDSLRPPVPLGRHRVVVVALVAAVMAASGGALLAYTHAGASPTRAAAPSSPPPSPLVTAALPVAPTSSSLPSAIASAPAPDPAVVPPLAPTSSKGGARHPGKPPTAPRQRLYSRD